MTHAVVNKVSQLNEELVEDKDNPPTLEQPKRHRNRRIRRSPAKKKTKDIKDRGVIKVGDKDRIPGGTRRGLPRLKIDANLELHQRIAHLGLHGVEVECHLHSFSIHHDFFRFAP